jgi:hypothetical protein
MSTDLKSLDRTAARGSTQIAPLTTDERRQFADIEWAQQDADVLRQYKGQFVVPHMKQIVAHGQDIRAVLEQAAQKTGKTIEELPVIGIDDSLTDVTAP